MIINLTKPKEIQFGTQEYFDLIEKTEGDSMKAKGFRSSIRHFCNIKHFVKSEEPTEEDLIRIDKECQCRNGKLYTVCENGHPTETQYTLNVLKNCKKCIQIMNQYASTFETEDMIKKREADAEDSRRYQEVQEQIKARKEEAEAQRIAKLELRVEELKRELAKKEE